MAGLNTANFSGHRVEYNGVKIGGGDSNYSFMPHESDLVGVPVYDDAGRTVTRIDYTLRVATFLFKRAAANTTIAGRDGTAEELQRLLEEENKSLIIGGMGFGNLDITKDVMWGPKPKVLSFKPIGGALAHEIIWQVDFSLKPCPTTLPDGSVPSQQYLAFNWGSQFSNDNEGLLTHTVSGYYEIPRNANTAKFPAVISDQRREDFKVPVPVGFRRIRNDYTNNTAKTRTDFFVTDLQFTGDAFPVGISNAIGDYSFSTNDESFQTNTATLTMALTVQPGFPMSAGGFFFLIAALKKVDELRSQASSSEADKDPVILPLSFTAREILWTRTTIFSMSFHVTSTLAELLSFTQLWRPLGNQTGNIEDFTKWQAGRDEHQIDNPRGFSRLAELASEDEIINACTGLNTSRVIGKLASGKSPVREFPSQRFGCSDDIDELNSWLSSSWKIKIKNDQQDSVFPLAVINPFKAVSDFISGIAKNNNLGGNLLKTLVPFTQDGSSDYVAERHGDSATRIRFHFMGFRVKYAWQFPVIDKIGDVELIPEGSAVFEVEPHACVLGCSVQFGRGYQDFITKDGERITEIESFESPNTRCAPIKTGEGVKKNPTVMPPN